MTYPVYQRSRATGRLRLMGEYRSECEAKAAVRLCREQDRDMREMGYTYRVGTPCLAR